MSLNAMHKTIAFRRADEPGTEIVLTAVGDIMMQGKTQHAAHQAADPSVADPDLLVASGFERLFDQVRDDLNRGDLLYGNLETPVASGLIARCRRTADGRLLCDEIDPPPGVLCDGQAYGETAYPRLIGRLGLPNFNAHPSLATALKAVGFDVLSTANNHALDRGHNGLDRTIDALRRAGLGQVGTIRSDEVAGGAADGYPSLYPCLIKEARGVRIAFFSLTSFLNLELIGFRERTGQVCMFPGPRQRERLACLIEAIGRARADPRVDLIAVSAHWGIDNMGHVLRSERRLAQIVIAAGADLVLGHHPHVLQPMEKVMAPDGREALVLYSMGNFTTDMPGVSSRSTAIFYIAIRKNDTGAFLSSVRFLPVTRAVAPDGRKGQALIQPVSIARQPADAFRRHWQHVIRVLGPGNCLPRA